MLIRGFYLLTGKFFRRNNLWLLTPVIALILSWMLSAYGVSALAPDVVKGFKLLVFLLAPGCYLAVILGDRMGLRLDETLILDILISVAIAMLVCIYLSFPLFQITESEIFGGLLVVTVLSGLVLLPHLSKLTDLKEKITLLNTSKAVTGLLISFLIGFLLTLQAIPESYWRGWDPWLNTPVTEAILEGGLNPSELSDRYRGVANVGISGFYYFLGAIQAFTGISFYSITRFGGPVLAGMVSIVTYLVVRRLEGEGAGFLASFFLFLNPFFMKRFSMALRENFGYIFFLGILLLLIAREQAFQRDQNSRFWFAFALSLFLATSLSSQSLVLLIVYGVVTLEMIFSIFKTRRIHIELILALFFSLVLATPYSLVSFSAFVWTINNWVLSTVEVSILIFIVAAIIVVFLIFHNGIRQLKFSQKHIRKGGLVLGVALFIGAFYSVLFPKSSSILGYTFISLEMFATSTLILAFLGFLSAIWTSAPTSILSLSLILILLPNLTNINVAFPLFRLVIYMSWVLSYGSAKFLKFLYELHREVELKFSKSLHFLRKSFEIKNFRASIIVCVMLLMLLSPLMLEDFRAGSIKVYEYYKKEDVDSALDFLSLLEDSDVVVPQDGTQMLLLYSGIDPSMLVHGAVLEELYSINNLQNFSQKILSEYPNASRAHIFMLQKWMGRKDYPIPLIQFLEGLGLGEKHLLESVVFYTIPLSYSEKELLKSPIAVQIPAGPQWVLIDLTDIDLSEGVILTLRIINRGEPKRFIAIIDDIHENSTEEVRFTLQHGDYIYYISLSSLAQAVDLSNPVTLALCFSWFTEEPSIDLTIINMTLVVLKR